MFCSDVNATAALRLEFAEVGATWVAGKLGGPNIMELLQLRNSLPL